MPTIESQEKMNKSIDALKDYQSAMRRVAAAQSVANEKLGVLKSLTGISSNDAAKIEEELLLMVGRAKVFGNLED